MKLLKNIAHAFALGIVLYVPVGGANANAAEVAQGVTDKEILVGHLGPQTGPVAGAYDKIRMGIESYFKYVNEQGGVHGRQLKLIAYDDQYQPGKAVQLTQRLVEEDKVFALLGNICTPCNVAALPRNKKSGIPMIMVGSGSSQFVNPVIPNYLGSSIANYEFDARVLASYAASKLSAKRVAIAYQNDDYGTPLAKAVAEALKEHGNIELLQEVKFQSADSDLSTQAQRIRQFNPDAIIVLSVPSPAAQLKKALYNIGVTKPHFLVSSIGADSQTLFNLAGESVWNGTISTSVFPKPGQSDNKSVKLYVERFSKDFPNVPIADFGQNGWALAEVFVEALRRTKSLTWGDFIESFNTFDNWTGSMYAGVTFSASNHYGLTSMYMTEAKNGAITPISKPITFIPDTGKIVYPAGE